MSSKVCASNILKLVIIYGIVFINSLNALAGAYQSQDNLTFVSDIDLDSTKNVCRVKRIANGTSVTGERIYSVVSMMHRPSWWFMEYEHVCGGVLITSQWVVTSAHCFFGNRQISHIGVGSACRSSMKHYEIDAVIVHKDYVHECCIFDNDIAVVRSKKTITIVNLDSLPTINRYELKAMSKGLIYGWGKTETGKYSNILKKTKLVFFSSGSVRTCEGRPLICAYAYGKTPLEGDSGSPILSLNNRFLYGIHIGSAGDYSVISSAAHYYNWIMYVMYEYKDILPNKMPANKIIYCCNSMNWTVYQTSGLIIPRNPYIRFTIVDDVNIEKQS